MMASTESIKTSQLQFAPFSSALSAGFWHSLSQKKLDEFGLDDGHKPVSGFYFNGDPPGLPCRLTVEYDAFDVPAKTPARHFPSHGTLYNTNTIDTFKSCDKKALLHTVSQQIWEDIKSGRAMKDPSLLSRFLLLTFADLKKYHYYYWFTFPALCTPENVTVIGRPVHLCDRFSKHQVEQLQEVFDSVIIMQQLGFFLAVEKETTLQLGSLEQFDSLSQHGKVILCFCDPCTLEGNPGWPLRNFLALAAYHWFDKLSPTTEVICFRERVKDGVRDCSHSIVFNIQIPSLKDVTECPACVGWEKNAKGKLGPRMVNLSSSMDPVRLAESSVDLNLKLMRWRLLPDLDLDKIAQTRCLLLGSGTLGCNIARCLLGWGVRTITFVDNGRISYSNPVRQSLFEFADCVNGGKYKSEAAADALRKIFPGVNTKGIILSIPMPGHPVSDSSVEQTKQDVAELTSLIQDHDVVFLLMDTRESRWLPTMLAASEKKIVLNAALGFDSFLVVRHGIPSYETDMDTGEFSFNSPIPGNQLGCYFCNDVVAPGDSTRDRTLDQQCTVSRPGMSMLTSALAVELLMSMLQHPDGPLAPADTSAHDNHLTQDITSELGLVPHQIRGYLSRYHQVLPAARRFDKCTACSQVVLEGYRKDGFDFLLNAFNQPKYLEDLTGLTKLHAETDACEVWDFSDDESI